MDEQQQLLDTLCTRLCSHQNSGDVVRYSLRLVSTRPKSGLQSHCYWQEQKLFFKTFLKKIKAILDSRKTSIVC